MIDGTLEGLAAAIRAKAVSSEEATRAVLAAVERLNGRLRAFVAVDAEGALAAARARDRDLAAGRIAGPLHGVPLAHKDLFVVPGLPTACGTKTPDYYTASDGTASTVIERLHAAGAVTVGKLNMTELAMGAFGDNAHHGHCQNPWRLGHATGGSSSGSGAAVAAGIVTAALGTDTGGSIRLPAAACGVVGLKPTYGRVSRAGAMALSWSNDHIGPLARTVRDAALVLGAIAGADARDATASPRPVPDYLAGIEGGVAGLRVGIPANYFFNGVTPEVAAAVRRAADVFAGLGAVVQELNVPDPAALLDVTGLISRAEASAIHARLFHEHPDDIQPVVRARLELGFRLSATDYLNAQRLKARMTREFLADVFGTVDVLLAPAIPEPAPSYAAVLAGPVEAGVERTGHFSRLTRPFNGLGVPVLGVPCGVSADGLPIGLQIAGRPFAEAVVLRAGRAYERATDWHTLRPEVRAD